MKLSAIVALVFWAILLSLGTQCKSTRNRNIADLDAEPLAAGGEADGPIGFGSSCAACLCILAAVPEAVAYQAKALEPTAEFMEKHSWCERNWACHGNEYLTPLPTLQQECAAQALLMRWKKLEGKAVCIYEYSFFGGAEQCYTSGDIPDLGENWQDRVSSLRVFGGAQLEYWESPNYQGKGRKTRSSWIPRLEDSFDDKINSMKIR